MSTLIQFRTHCLSQPLQFKKCSLLPPPPTSFLHPCSVSSLSKLKSRRILYSDGVLARAEDKARNSSSPLSPPPPSQQSPRREFRFVFTSDPSRLWRLGDALQCVSHKSVESCDVSPVAEFISCFGTRIMCLDASIEEELSRLSVLEGQWNFDGRLDPKPKNFGKPEVLPGDESVKVLQRKRHLAAPGVSFKGRVRKVAKWRAANDGESEDESERHSRDYS